MSRMLRRANGVERATDTGDARYPIELIFHLPGSGIRSSFLAVVLPQAANTLRSRR